MVCERWYVTKLLYVKFVCVIVCEVMVCEYRREEAGGGGARDTESKTRTPHKVVGNKNNPHACNSPVNARTFPTRDFTASCGTTCKSHFMCASGDGKRSKHANNKFKKPCGAAVDTKVKVQLTTSKLSWTHKLPQPEMFSQEIKKHSELWWICQFFYLVSVYYPFWFLRQMALVRPYCRDIVQSSLVNHHN